MQLKEKSQEFILSTLEGRSFILKLDSLDLNEMYLRGENRSKYLPGVHYYYEIVGDRIVELRIQWPETTKDGCYMSRREISFSRKDSDWIEESHYYYSQDHVLSFLKEQTLSLRLFESTFLAVSLGVTNVLALFKYHEPEEYRKFVCFTRSIKNIEIFDDCLVLTS
ncbi:hypothetical protein [Synechococcus sp. PCC 7336]|uniref:hypothetical protein n=1 Tax=Synechococcus sp. PCC 7336 TaxID=195250 RepID=UPI000365CF68|nr:hypothetical protein [Synechococcus sp. PCC 7336]